MTTAFWVNYVGQYLPGCVLCIFSRRGQSLKVRIQVTNERSGPSEARTFFVMPAMLWIAEILYSKWHLGIDQTLQIDAAGLITWIALIYANTLKC